MVKFFNIKNIMIIIIIIIVMGTLQISCEKKNLESKIIPLVKVGDRIISKDEFIRRAEYTIRPPYCKQNYGHHKKIVLNSLIAEKLLALETNPNSVLKKGNYQDKYIRGRKEQAMRQYFFYNEAYKKAKVDTNKILTIYKSAGKKYKVKYCNLPNKKSAAKIEELLQEGESFNDIFKNVFEEGKIPEREIGFDSPQVDAVFDALFVNKVKKGEVIGPIKTGTNDFLIMKVEGWTDKLAISDRQAQQRYEDVSKKLTMMEAEEIYEDYILEIMSGKRLEFEESTFRKLEGLFADLYYESKKKQKNKLNQTIWDREANTNLIDSLGNRVLRMENRVLFTIEGKKWTVRDFLEELQSHPLVYGKKNIRRHEYPGHFRQAIADLIRDKYLTEEAYKKGYGELNVVKNYTNMFQDHLLSQYQKNKYLKKVKSKNDSNTYFEDINNYLNPYIDSLQNKYADRIEINTEAFNQIKLTNIDMVALQSNIPFPVVVPSFPILTTDSKLDYGKEYKEEQ